jgi:dethiobiotin synthetase
MTVRYFIAGTDTGVGKTRVICGLLAAARAGGYRVAGMKPVSAGLIDVDGTMINEDVVMIMRASQQQDPQRLINPYALLSPVSPHIAAKRQQIAIDIDTISASADALALDRELLLVEGAGGWHAPVSDSATMADIALSLQAPVLLVVGLKLGCLNHARLSLEAIRGSGLGLAGWIGSEIDPEMQELGENRRYLEAMFGEKALSWLPFEADPGNDARHLASALPRLLPARASI